VGHDLHRLFRQNYDRVWRLLRSLGVPPDRVDDAAQQVFLIFAERQADVAEASAASFLYGTALRVAHGVRRANHREVPADVDVLAPHLPGPDELSDQKRARDLLDAVLERMEPDLRTVFVLYEMEELTVPEIAKIVEIPEGTAASRLRRARESFSDLVRRWSGSQRRRAV
jgi:RNA polymerase sigma-70 factor (ECF subfamily)